MNTILTYEECIKSYGDEKGKKVFDKLTREVMGWNGVSVKDIHIIKTDNDGRK